MAVGLTTTPPVRAEDAVALHYLDQLIPGLRQATDQTRADFAAIAIAEVAAAYADEAQRARREMRRVAGQRELSRWVQAVDRLAEEFATLAGSISSASHVMAALSPENSVYLVVDGRPVVLNGPVPDRQQALEQRIIDRFCRLHHCRGLLQHTLLSTPDAPVPANDIEVRWSFSDTGKPSCSADNGLAFRFVDTRNLLQKRTLCAQLIGDLDRLVEALGRRRASGTPIDWNAVRMRGSGADARLALNHAGDLLDIRLDVLSATPGLLERLRPWLAARLNGVELTVTIEQAETLLEDAWPGLM